MRQRWWSEIDDHLGGVYPLYDRDTPQNQSLNLQALVKSRLDRGQAIKLNLKAVQQKALMPFIIGDETLISDIDRAPWMSRYDDDGKWIRLALPPHKSEVPSSIEGFVESFRGALVQEAARYIGNSRVVGLLLSGGMDSRVVAGVLRSLQLSLGNQFEVVALTWGEEASRDVVYAKRVAEKFGWQIEIFPLTAETLFNNFGEMARIGAEVSPLHLHAMPEIGRRASLDVVIAGSYGDSVGRAEYSGTHLANIGPIVRDKRVNPFGFLRHHLEYDTVSMLRKASSDGLLSGGERSRVGRREVERQQYYMRRMLQVCMTTIAAKTPVYQMFTDPRVFSLMWSLAPVLRNDDWYSRLLALLPGDLLTIPWARTGSMYNQSPVTPDSFSKANHKYGLWLRRELKRDVIDRVLSDKILGLGVFNEQALRKVTHIWAKCSAEKNNSIDEILSWIACFHDFLEQYQPSIEKKVDNYQAWPDLATAIKGSFYAHYYLNKGKLRKPWV